MILDVTKSNLDEIKNPVLREYANIYVQIYQNFMEQVQAMGLMRPSMMVTSIIFGTLPFLGLLLWARASMNRDRDVIPVAAS